MSRNRNYCVTDFVLDREFWDNFVDKCKYLIIGEEICPDTKKTHWQIYFNLKSAASASSIQKQLNPRHIEVCKGNPKQNIDYCKKDGNIILEFGEAPAQGKRSDLQSAAEEILSGKKLNEIDPVIFIKYNKGCTLLRERVQKARDFAPNILWIWGNAGAGKTRFAVEYSNSFYIKDGTQWWDGYDHEDTIIIDDFDGRWPYRDLLRLLDRYPYRGQIKGGYVQINSKNIILTCEFPPEHFWSDNALKQVTRRLTETKNLNSCT